MDASVRARLSAAGIRFANGGRESSRTGAC